MNNSANVKKQTRVLIVTAALILSLAAVVILLSVSQSRKGGKPGETSADSASGSVTHSDTGAADKPALFEGTTVPETKKPAETKAESAAVTTSPEASVPTAETLPDFIAPVSGMVSKSHSVDVPVYSLTMEDYRTHTGIDIAAASGTAVRAAAAGTVSEIWEDPMMGTCLKLSHKGGACSVYKNLAPALAEGIAAGTAVQAGTILGAVGESALAEIAEGSHLHYELEIDGTPVDPSEYMLVSGTDTAYEG